MPADRLTIATWNLQGSQGVDVAEVAQRLRTLSPSGQLDVVALQEVQRRQARAVAAALGLVAIKWAFKHWPIVHGVEGMAVLGRHRFAAAHGLPLHRAPFWSWRRRVMVVAAFADLPVTLADVHLSPHGQGSLRDAQADRLLAALDRVGAGRDAFVAGDFNDHPGTYAHAKLLALGWRDAWAEVHGDQPEPAGATNWTAGSRVGRAPTQRLDGILVPPGWVVEEAVVPAPEDGSYDAWAALSDHLPLVAVLRRLG